MGFRSTLYKIWRFLRPQWKAMTDREIEELDRTVTASMATGTFGLRQPDDNTNDDDDDTAADNNKHMTGDRLWSLGSSYSQHTRASRVSAASSRAYDAGYGGRPVSVVAAAADGHRVVSGRQQQQQHQRSQLGDAYN